MHSSGAMSAGPLPLGATQPALGDGNEVQERLRELSRRTAQRLPRGRSALVFRDRPPRPCGLDHSRSRQPTPRCVRRCRGLNVSTCSAPSRVPPRHQIPVRKFRSADTTRAFLDPSRPRTLRVSLVPFGAPRASTVRPEMKETPGRPWGFHLCPRGDLNQWIFPLNRAKFGVLSVKSGSRCHPLDRVLTGGVPPLGAPCVF